MKINSDLRAGIALAGLSVLFGAFGAHILKAHLDPRGLEIFRTGVDYQMFHSLALILAGVAGAPQKVGLCFGLGVLFFCGSLYALAITQISILGAITPFGGLLFLIGWGIWFRKVTRGVK